MNGPIKITALFAAVFLFANLTMPLATGETGVVRVIDPEAVLAPGEPATTAPDHNFDSDLVDEIGESDVDMNVSTDGTVTATATVDNGVATLNCGYNVADEVGGSAVVLSAKLACTPINVTRGDLFSMDGAGFKPVAPSTRLTVDTMAGTMMAEGQGYITEASGNRSVSFDAIGTAQRSMNCTLTCTATVEGESKYEATIFVWESVDNPT